MTEQPAPEQPKKKTFWDNPWIAFVIGAVLAFVVTGGASKLPYLLPGPNQNTALLTQMLMRMGGAGIGMALVAIVTNWWRARRAKPESK